MPGKNYKLIYQATLHLIANRYYYFTAVIMLKLIGLKIYLIVLSNISCKAKVATSIYRRGHFQTLKSDIQRAMGKKLLISQRYSRINELEFF